MVGGRRGASGRLRAVQGVVVAAVAIAAVTALIAVLRLVFPLFALSFLYLLVVVPFATAWGFRWSLGVAVVSILVFDLVITPPLFRLTAGDGGELAVLGISGLIAYVVSELAGRARRRAREAESLAGEIRRIADEQAALRRVATMVAHGAEPEQTFRSVAAEVGRLFGADMAVVFRFEPERIAAVVGRWDVPGQAFPDGARLAVQGVGVVVAILENGRPLRAERFEGPPGSVAATFAALGVRVGAGAPIIVEGRLWGAVVAAATEPERLPTGTEDGIARFTELLDTAVANAQARVELRRSAEEQAALRRVATLVAREAPPEEVFAEVAAEIGRLLPADLTAMARYGADGAVTGVGRWTASGDATGTRVPSSRGGRNVTTLVYETRRPARIDNYTDASGISGDVAKQWGLRSAVGVPIEVGGHLWGVMLAASTGDVPLPPDTDARLARFTELLATGIANAQAREELRDHAEEQAALRRVATLVARGAPPREVFDAVTAEVGGVMHVVHTAMSRYDADGSATVVSAWVRPGVDIPDMTGRRVSSDGRNVSGEVFRTRRPARIDAFGADIGTALEDLLAGGLHSAVGAPIWVEGRLWGVMIVASTRDQPLPIDTEARLAAFTELVATAVANAEAQAQLSASRVRIMTTADAARRRIERDLHDGAQQHLVSLALQLRAAQAAVPPEASGLNAQLDGVGEGLTDVLEELREIARGLHPAILAEGGLRPAIRTLARRSPVPARVTLGVDGRLPQQVEVAAYFVVAEALTNVAKHASASAVHIEVHLDDGRLHVRVSDDGRGGALLSGGSGLLGLKDRVEALGGRLAVSSPVGRGTDLQVDLPLA